MTLAQASKLKRGDKLYCIDNDYHHPPLNHLMKFMINRGCLLIVTRVVGTDVHFRDTRVEHESTWYLKPHQLTKVTMSTRYDFMVYLKGLGDY